MSFHDKLDQLKAYTSQFSRKFWIINTLELFERGAYYATMALLAIHIHDNLGYSASTFGILTMLLMILLYFVPLVAAALAEKIGYRKTLIGSFLFMIVGYTSFGLFSELWLLVVSILFLGIGAGAFKPIISATVAHVTTENQRNAGYSIYYWMINLGAFVFPLAIGLTKPLGIMDPEGDDAKYVFFLSTAIISINLLITLFKVEDPIEPNLDKDVFASLKVLGTVLHDRNFIMLLVIYSGFWYMFSINHAFLPLYMVHFHIMPDWFSIFYLAVINPGTIIAVGFYLSKIVEKYDSLHLMILGISTFVVGVMILSMTMVPALFFAGIIIFSIGEFITHPNFIAYVSKIAPKDKVAVYMGYVFIPTGVGYALGLATGGILFEIIAENMERPKLFWGIVASVGLLTVVGFVFYDIYIAGQAKRELIKTALPVADGEEEMEYQEPEAEEFAEHERKPSPINIKIPYISESKWSKHFPAVLAFFFIFVVIGTAYSGGTNTYYEEEDEFEYRDAPDWTDGEVYTGYTNEGQETVENESFEVNGVSKFRFILSWEDEADASNNHENQPDEFYFTVETPWGKTYESDPEENEHGEEQTIEMEIDVTKDDVEKAKTDKAKTSGEFTYTIHCNEAGDQTDTRPFPLGNDEADDGNDWEFSVYYKMRNKFKKGEAPGKI